MVDVFMQKFGEYHYVIQVYKDTPIKHIPEDAINECLKNCILLSVS